MCNAIQRTVLRTLWSGLQKPKGTIQKGLFFSGVGLQVYVPGQSELQMEITRAACEVHHPRLYFETVALTYDELDYIQSTLYKCYTYKC